MQGKNNMTRTVRKMKNILAENYQYISIKFTNIFFNLKTQHKITSQHVTQNTVKTCEKPIMKQILHIKSTILNTSSLKPLKFKKYLETNHKPIHIKC